MNDTKNYETTENQMNPTDPTTTRQPQAAPAENPEEAASLLRKLRLVLRAARSSREQETED